MTLSRGCVGLVSDTHGHFDPRLTAIFQGVDLILHAGDVGSGAVLAALHELAPLKAVRGNVDRTGDCARLPWKAVIELQDVAVLLVHQIGKPRRLLPQAVEWIRRHRPALVVYGHSHVPGDETVDGIRFVNPGSAGKKRFRLPRTCALLRLGEGGLEIEHRSLE